MSISLAPSVFPNADTFEHVLEFLEIADFARISQVCKSWNDFIKTPIIWRKLFKKEGIPLVDGPERNYREDFKTLYSITISGRIIGKLFGEVVGPISPISEKVFNKLQDLDPYEKGKFKRETFVFVVDPHLIRRTIDKGALLALDESGNLIEYTSNSTETGTAEKQVLEIPFSAPNHWVLCSHPLSGKENMPVFDKGYDPDVFKQCAPCPDRNRVWFMRKCVAEQTRRESYAEQKKLVEAQGDEVTPLRVRALFDSVKILTSRTCPDNNDPQAFTFARTSDTVRCGNKVHQLVIGGFAPYRGMHADDDYGHEGHSGVAPGIPADVLQS